MLVIPDGTRSISVEAIGRLKTVAEHPDALKGAIECPKTSPSPTFPLAIQFSYTIFLSFGLAWTESLNADGICIGLNALNYSDYRDCRPDYIQAMQEVFRLGTKQGREGEAISISTPLSELKKTQIIKVRNN